MAKAKQEKKTRIKQGVIVSLDSGKDTIKVKLERKFAHPRYTKQVKVDKNYLVHLPEAEKENYELGQEIKIQETSPISKSKNWKVAK